MLYKLGRFLQVVGLLVAPVGIAGNVADPVNVPLMKSLTIAVAGIAIFTLGWLLQQGSRPEAS
jgi:hypothetical protein